MSKIPKTDSIEELAKFRDSHDLTEFEDGIEEVREPVFEELGILFATASFTLQEV